jgi:heat shock protein HslJ
MTDERMDARLRAAGERWRTANTEVAEPSEPSEVEIASPATPSRHRNWWAIASAAVVVAALALGAVLFARSSDTGNSAAGIGQLTGVTWTDPHSNGAVVFLDGSARVTEFCGTDTHPLTVDGDQLTIGTKVLGIGSGCADPGIKRTPTQQRRYDEWRRARAQFLRIVHGPATWSIAGNTLTLTTAGVGTLRLMTDGTPAPQAVGTRWRLAGYYGFKQDWHRATGANLHITADGHFTAGDLCGTLVGTADVSLTTMTLDRTGGGPICSPPISLTPMRVIDAILKGTVEYSISGDEMVLRKHGSPAMLTYRAVPTPESLLSRLIGSWRLETIATSGGTTTAMTDATLAFDRNGRFGLGRSCPGFGFKGAVAVSAQSMTISRVQAATGPVCPNEAPLAELQQNDAVDAVLMSEGTVSWSLSGDRLTITRDDTHLTFVQASDGVASTLVGSWQVDTISHSSGNSGGGTTATSDIMLNFGRTGSVLISHRCYESRGSATSSGDRITFSGLHRSDHSCPANPPANEEHEDTAVDSVLTGTVSWSVGDGRLIITKGGTQLRFVRPGADSTTLTGSRWVLRTVQNVADHNVAPRIVSVHLAFRFDADSVNDGSCGAASATMTSDRIEFSSTWTFITPTGCAMLPVQQSNFVYRRVLSGTVAWSISGGTLTITKEGVGILTFVKTK